MSKLALLQSEIEQLEDRQATLNLNPNFESDLENLNQVKYQINLISSEINRLKLRKSLILEAQEKMKASVSNIDVQQLQQIYQQATSLVTSIQKTFEEFYYFHNQMVESKIRFISQELPQIETDIATHHEQLKHLLTKEKALTWVVTKIDFFEMLEQLIAELNKKYQDKGEYENTLRQLNDIDLELRRLNEELK